MPQPQPNNTPSGDTYVALPNGTYVQVPANADPADLAALKVKLAAMFPDQIPKPQRPNFAQTLMNLQKSIPFQTETANQSSADYQHSLGQETGPEHFASKALSAVGLPTSVEDFPNWIRSLAGVPANQPMRLGSLADQPIVQNVKAAIQKPTQENLVKAVPIAGPLAASMAEDVRNKDYTGAAGTAAGILGAIRGGEEVGPGLQARSALKEANAAETAATEGPANISKALKTPPGKNGVRAMQMQADLKTAAPDLAQIERDTPLSKQTLIQKLGHKGDPEWFNETASNIADYKEDLWQRGHTAVVEQYGDMPFNSQAVADKALSEISKVDDTGQAKLAKQWVQREIANKLDTLQDADQKVRLLNQDIKTLPERFGPVGVRVRQAALQGLRDQIDTQLESVGATGVREVNRRYGALRNIQNRLQERYFQETGKAASKGDLPAWAQVYAFAHPGGVAAGVGASLGRMVAPEAATQLRQGMQQLAGSKRLSPTVPMVPDIQEQSIPSTVYRARSVGEQGIPTAGSKVHAQATTSMPQAAGYLESRGNTMKVPQELVSIYTKGLKEGVDYTQTPHPDGMTWIKFLKNPGEKRILPVKIKK